MVRKWWEAGYCFTLMLLAAGLFFSSQDWMQGFIKHEALSFLLSVSEKAGQKLDEFQKTTTTVQDQVNQHHGELRKHQAEITGMQSRLATAQNNVEAQEKAIGEQQSLIKSQQIVVSEQQDKLRDTQSSLQAAQEKLAEQQRQLADIEVLLRNIYSRTRTEMIRGSDSNRVFYASSTDTACWVFFSLGDVPIHQSVQGYFGNSPMKPGSLSQKGNVVFTVFRSDTNSLKGEEFTFSYLVDVPNSAGRADVTLSNGVPYIGGESFGFLMENKAAVVGKESHGHGSDD